MLVKVHMYKLFCCSSHLYYMYVFIRTGPSIILLRFVEIIKVEYVMLVCCPSQNGRVGLHVGCVHDSSLHAIFGKRMKLVIVNSLV